MKKNLFILLPILAGVLACNDDNNNDCPKEQVTATWAEGKAISEGYGLTDGKNKVFWYSDGAYGYAVNGALGLQCLELSGEGLIFEVEDSVTEFEFTDEAIAKTNCFYYKHESSDVEIYFDSTSIKKGIIKGEKLSEDQWKIMIEITASPPHKPSKTIHFVKIYSKCNAPEYTGLCSNWQER